MSIRTHIEPQISALFLPPSLTVEIYIEYGLMLTRLISVWGGGGGAL